MTDSLWGRLIRIIRNLRKHASNDSLRFSRAGILKAMSLDPAQASVLPSIASLNARAFSFD